MKKDRRKFIKNLGVIGATGMLIPNVGLGQTESNMENSNNVRPKVLFLM